MSIDALCAVCEAAPGEHACQLCGAVVCDEHFDDERGCCAGCAAGAGGPGDVGGGGDTLR